jgi:hypothetical protein
MITSDDKEAKNATSATAKPTTYPGKNDGKISASKNAGMRTGASRPGPKKK